MQLSMNDRRMNREDARHYLTAKIDHQRRRVDFSNIDRDHLVEDATFRLRWLDCAPEGALFCVAPLQDKAGIPCGTAWSENVGPCKALREARTARGISGYRVLV
jgi:hypothetical protein